MRFSRPTLQVYCDLKPSSILLDEKGSLKLGGFGLSQKIATVQPLTLQQVPLQYSSILAPQALHRPASVARASSMQHRLYEERVGLW